MNRIDSFDSIRLILSQSNGKQGLFLIFKRHDILKLCFK